VTQQSMAKLFGEMVHSASIEDESSNPQHPVGGGGLHVFLVLGLLWAETKRHCLGLVTVSLAQGSVRDPVPRKEGGE
jgi:hypothetical protein